MLLMLRKPYRCRRTFKLSSLQRKVTVNLPIPITISPTGTRLLRPIGHRTPSKAKHPRLVNRHTKFSCSLPTPPEILLTRRTQRPLRQNLLRPRTLAAEPDARAIQQARSKRNSKQRRKRHIDKLKRYIDRRRKSHDKRKRPHLASASPSMISPPSRRMHANGFAKSLTRTRTVRLSCKIYCHILQAMASSAKMACVTLNFIRVSYPIELMYRYAEKELLVNVLQSSSPAVVAAPAPRYHRTKPESPATTNRLLLIHLRLQIAASSVMLHTQAVGEVSKSHSRTDLSVEL